MSLDHVPSSKAGENFVRVTENNRSGGEEAWKEAC
jgi:hypothetical protein